MQSLWKYVRGPFYVVQCITGTDHQWECFDCDKAGCILCGATHTCCVDPCLVHDNLDKSITCTITGYSIPSIRTSDNEYFENYIFTKPIHTNSVGLKVDEIRDFVAFVIEDFLFNNKMKVCKMRENQKKIQKIITGTIRWLKAYKIANPDKMPSVHSVIAHSLAITKTQYTNSPTKDLITFCTQHITKCVIDLELVQIVMNKTQFVIGMLYLMKSGLCINNAYWLPKMYQLTFCLPQENSLEKVFGISIKTICETENYIKLILRNKNKSL